jgi:hypothetical protein
LDPRDSYAPSPNPADHDGGSDYVGEGFSPLGVRSFLRARCSPARPFFRREYALVYRAGLLNKTGSFEVTLRDKSNNVAHLLSKAESFGGNIPPTTASLNNSWFRVFRIGRPAPITSGFF